MKDNTKSTSLNNENLVTTTYPVSGMHCASCKANIERTIKKIPGVSSINVNFATEKAQVSFDPKLTNLVDMNEKILPYGYTLNDTLSKNQNSEHKMPDGTVMKDGEMDHSQHAAAPKEEQLKVEKNKALKVFPLSIFVFLLMLWEIAAEYLMFIPDLPLGMDVYQKVLFIIATYVLFSPGKMFIQAMFRFIKVRRASMDTLVGMGTLTAYIYSSFILLFPDLAMQIGLADSLYFDVTIVVIGFILFGKYLEAASKKKTGEALEKLMQLQAKIAIVIRNGKEIEIPVEQVVIGDKIIVKPGGKIPVDGVIVKGSTSIDESLVTGEPLPVDKEEGENVIGGTINQQSVFTMTAKKVGKDTLLSQIVQMVESAQGSKAPIERLADQVSAIFVPIVMVIAVVTLLFWILAGFYLIPMTNAVTLGLTSFVGILVIACPCALGLATPTAIIVGVGKAAEHGILVKDAESLEKLKHVTTVVMDKTGTLTTGKPIVTDIVATDNYIKANKNKSKNELDKQILTLLASLEKSSEHPLAHAILEKAKTEKVKIDEVTSFEIVKGKGVKGKILNKIFHAGNRKYMEELGMKVEKDRIESYTKMGKTPIMLSVGKDILGIVYISDTLKENAADAVKTLQKRGIKVVMLTGDDLNTAKYIGKAAGVNSVIAEVLPDQKAMHIKKLQQQNEEVAMVGDGVNDAPALATADVGIAMSTGTDVAIGAAQLTILKGDIKKVVDAIRISQLTMRTVKQNLFWAFIYNIIGIPLAAGLFYPFFGLMLNPVFAGAAMAFSSVSVVSNSLLLKRLKL